MSAFEITVSLKLSTHGDLALGETHSIESFFVFRACIALGDLTSLGIEDLRSEDEIVALLAFFAMGGTAFDVNMPLATTHINFKKSKKNEEFVNWH